MDGSEIGASDHLARLWALEQIRSWSAAPSAEQEDLDSLVAKERAAELLAVQYRLVTALTGAVVLENKAAYEAARLSEPKGLTGLVPTVPEPEALLIMIPLALFLLLVALRMFSLTSKQGGQRC